jgi:plasmid stabilization system protein ParE
LRYVVEISGPAQADIDKQADYLVSEGAAAERIQDWVNRIEDAIASLAKMPERCPRIPEPLPAVLLTLHHLVAGAHRIVFGIDRQNLRVIIYRVFHGARVLQSLG